MKTAAEMRAVNPKFAAQNIIAELEKSIEFANRQGWTEVRFGSACTSTERFKMIEDWIAGRDNPAVEEVVTTLRNAGYKVTDIYEERQFVDMDILISWDE